MSLQTLKVSGDVKGVIDTIAERNGMTLLSTMEALVARWLKSSEEDQRQAIHERKDVLADPAFTQEAA